MGRDGLEAAANDRRWALELGLTQRRGGAEGELGLEQLKEEVELDALLDDCSSEEEDSLEATA